MGEDKKVSLLDKLYDKAKDDLILIPRSLRIWIDVLLAIGIFFAMVLYPAYRSLEIGIWGGVDYLFMSTGTFLSILFIFFAYRAIKQKKGA